MLYVTMQLSKYFFSFVVFVIHMCCFNELIGVAQHVNFSFISRWHAVLRKHFLFCAPLILKHYHHINSSLPLVHRLCKHSGISLHKPLGVCVTTGNITHS